MNFDLHKFVSEAEEKIPETVSDSSGAVLTPGKPQTCEGNGSLPASRNIVIRAILRPRNCR